MRYLILVILSASVMIATAEAAMDPRSMKNAAAEKQGASQRPAPQQQQEQSPYLRFRPAKTANPAVTWPPATPQSAPAVQSAPAAQQPDASITETESAETDTEAVDQEAMALAAIIEAFRVSARPWRSITDPKIKVDVVKHFISRFLGSGVLIQKGPDHYVVMIDDLSAHNSAMLNNPLELVLQTLAIIEYDFENGQDKDLMARKILGEEGYLRNKQRIIVLWGKNRR